jgi:hypothetical protein
MSMPWTAQPSEWWLDAQPQSGNTAATITVQPNSTLLDEGAHNTELTFAATTMSRTVAVTYIITASTGTDDLAHPAALRLHAWPQPVSHNGILRVSIDGPAGQKYQLSLYDVLGRQRTTERVEINETTTFDLSAIGLSSGMYLLRLQSDTGMQRVRKVHVVH